MINGGASCRLNNRRLAKAGQLLFGPVQGLCAENRRLQSEPVGRVGRVVAGQCLDPVQSVGDGAYDRCSRFADSVATPPVLK
jgi:hypothetical protein